MFPAPTPQGWQRALDDNRRALDEANDADAPCLVLVVGGCPARCRAAPAHKDIARRAQRGARRHRATARVRARSVGMPLAIEPLHPMYAADRACINTLEQALDVCDALDPQRSGRARRRGRRLPRLVGPEAAARRSRAPAASACSPSTSATGWRRPRDLLNDRGMMGDGVIDIPRIRGWVEAAGLRRLQRGRDLLDARLVEARRRRGARHLHRAAPQRAVARMQSGGATPPPAPSVLAPRPTGATRPGADRTSTRSHSPARQ